MSAKGRQQPNGYSDKRPGRYWRATPPFLDLKASHWVEIALTAALVGVGLAQLSVYWRQQKIMSSQAKISGQQVRQADRALIASQRPWLEIADAALTLDKMGLVISLRNTGPSPALGIGINVFALPLSIQPEDVSATLHQRGLCDRSGKRVDSNGRGVAIFSGEKEPPFVRPIEGLLKGATFLAVCVDYEFALSREEGRHQTAVLYSIGQNGRVSPFGAYAD